jgi:ABC-2 type transport system permease protein
MTFLIATHYMDEAERCHRLAFILSGRLLTHGPVAEVVAQTRLVTWAVSGPGLQELMAELRAEPGVEQAVAFGNDLHVSGSDPEALARAIASPPRRGASLARGRLEPRGRLHPPHEARATGRARAMNAFSLRRFAAIVSKEFIQMRRDRVTFAMMIGIPLMQLVLFSYAINLDPKHLPAAVVLADDGPQGRTLLWGLQNSGYFELVRRLPSEAAAREALARGEVQFVVNIPPGFTRDLWRGDRPAILVEADATDPGATGNAIGSLRTILASALRSDLVGPLSWLAAGDAPIELRVHSLYNPEAITQFNIVPGLMGVVLTMTLVLITGLAITRERETGTMENLLSMPARPFEVLLGKIVPYILVGYVQVGLILLASRFVFDVPMLGSVPLLLLVSLVFIASNLAVGITFSTVAQNQRQAMQMGMFFFLPSILLSGFMFPFRGMPQWAQWLGEVLPLTHYLRIVRGILLKGNSVADVLGHVWPLALFTAVALALGVKRYRRTLD